MTDSDRRKKLLDVPADVLDGIETLAKATRRSANAEIVVALEAHLERAHYESPRSLLERTTADAPTQEEHPVIGNPHRRGA